MSQKKLFKFALDLGEVMLSNGAETSRVEDTMQRILSKSNYRFVESFVTPTGIFTSMASTDDEEHPLSYIRRVHKNTTHMNKVARANQISRDFCNDLISLDEAICQLAITIQLKEYPSWQRLLATGTTAGFFVFVFGGQWNDFIVALIAGLLLGLIERPIRQSELSRFFLPLIGGALIGSVALLLTQVIPLGSNLNLIIIGAIMPLVPGVAITNAIRDTFEGDLVSGVSRAADAFILASLIAVGVGTVLKTGYLIGGWR